MLSRILKSFRKIRGDKINRIELPSELRMSLSFIESGCLATLIDNKTVFVFKGNQDEIDSLKKAEQMLFGFECIKRPEFPSVRMYFELRHGTNKLQLCDYFFGIESDEEMELLRSLKDQDYFDILCFSSDAIMYSKRVSLKEMEKEKIKAALDEALS